MEQPKESLGSKPDEDCWTATFLIEKGFIEPLSDAEDEQVFQHLKTCVHCRLYFSQSRKISSEMIQLLLSKGNASLNVRTRLQFGTRLQQGRVSKKAGGQ